MLNRPLVRRISYFYFAVCGLAILVLLGHELYRKFGSPRVTIESVPFGLPGGSEIFKGETPDFEGELEQLPFSTRDELHRANELLSSGEFSSALEIFEGILHSNKNSEVARFGAMNALFSLPESEASKVRLESFIDYFKSKNPDGSMRAYIDSRRALRAQSIKSALEFAHTASDRAQAFYPFRLWYGELLLENGQLERAEEEARVSISLSLGSSSQAYWLLSKSLHDQGKIDSCGRLLEYSLSKFPMDARLLLLKGFLDEYRGSFENAEKTYQKILAIRPDFILAKEALSTLGEKSPPGNGQTVSVTPAERARVATDILEPLVLQYPENLPLREALGRAYLKARLFDLAHGQFLEIQSKDPEYPDIQLRLQESIAVRSQIETENSGLTENLNRVADSLRSASPATKHDFGTKLGHYLVRYGASPREFFSKYSVSNFKKIKKNVWREQFEDAHYHHTYTVLFDEKNRYYGVHVRVVDSSMTGRELGRAPEIFTRLLAQNSRISGIGSATGETECDDTVIDAAVWDSQDNFELIARIVGKPEEVLMVRFDKHFLPMGLKLCDYLPYLHAY